MGWGLVLSRSKSEKERTLCWEGNKGSYGVTMGISGSEKRINKEG